MKVRCVRSFTLKGVLYVSGDQYDMPAKQATDYAEYFEKMKAYPKNKAKKTEENK
jgi:uncharacterized protein YjlB